MSRNGSGTYTLPAGNPVVTGTTISTTWANNTLNDIAATLTDSVAADGQTPMTGNLDLNNNKIVNLAPAAFAGDAVEYSQLVAATTGNVTITGGTINGTSIGATTASTGRFSTLTATGASTFTGVSTFSAGTVSAPAITTTGDTNTGIFFPAADTVAFTEGGVESMRITSAGDVGIGTSSPNQKLEVTGTIRVSRAGTPTTFIELFGGDGAIDPRINVPSGFGIPFSINGTDQARITSAGLLQFDSGYGSVATAYGCRAWVNFNGTGTVAIRASGNVSSITDNFVGNYTVNFTSAMPDANYSALVTIGVTGNASGTNPEFYGKASNFLTGSVNANSRTSDGGASDSEVVCVAILR
jgi:hypothetical protein